MQQPKVQTCVWRSFSVSALFRWTTVIQESVQNSSQWQHVISHHLHVKLVTRHCRFKHISVTAKDHTSFPTVGKVSVYKTWLMVGVCVGWWLQKSKRINGWDILHGGLPKGHCLALASRVVTYQRSDLMPITFLLVMTEMIAALSTATGMAEGGEMY